MKYFKHKKYSDRTNLHVPIHVSSYQLMAKFYFLRTSTHLSSYFEGNTKHPIINLQIFQYISLTQRILFFKYNNNIIITYRNQQFINIFKHAVLHISLVLYNALNYSLCTDFWSLYKLSSKVFTLWSLIHF